MAYARVMMSRQPAMSLGITRKRFRVLGLCCVMLLTRLGVSVGWAADDAHTTAELFHYDPKGHRDPFITLVREGRRVDVPKGANGATTKPVLYGILWDPGGNSIALINDGEAKVGDTIGGYHVVEIQQDGVVLSNGGEPVVLQIAFPGPGAKGSSDTTTGGEGQ